MKTQQWEKEEIYNILVKFDTFCRANNIDYILGYGTMLGAIRHQGFIPWDDDIDVVLTTENYYKLRRIAEENPYIDENNRYRFMLPGERNYCYSFIKLVDTRYRVKEKYIDNRYNIGLFIDVFRVDYWPDGALLEAFELRKARLLLKINEVLIRGNIMPGSKYALLDKVLKPIDIVLRLAGIKSYMICSRLEACGRKNKKSPYVGNIMSGSGKKSERLPAEIFDDVIYITFEDGEYPIPKEYDKYLKMIYGDYMKIPDVSTQIGHEYDIEVVGES